jgi:hypothetical protein
MGTTTEENDMAGQQRGPRNPSQRGDFTGNKKEALARENAEAVDARREELGIVTAQQTAIKDEGVIDLTSGQPTLDHPDLEPGEEVRINTATRQPSVQKDEPTEKSRRLHSSSGEGTYVVEELPEERPQAAVAKGEAITSETLNEPALIRSLYDLEDITIGYGNTYNLREGYRYKVPRWVAAHLEEKNLALVLSLNPT